MPTYRGFINLRHAADMPRGIETQPLTYASRAEAVSYGTSRPDYIATIEIEWYEPFERVGYGLVSGVPSHIVGMRPTSQVPEEFRSPIAGGGYPIPYDDPVDLVPLARPTIRDWEPGDEKVFGCQ